MRISLLLLLMLISIVFNTASAKLDYASLHEIESTERKPLFLRLNIVNKGQDLPLKFMLLSQNIETDMAAHRINNYMVRLASLRSAIGESYIVVYEFDGQVWNKATQVDISNQLTGEDFNTEKFNAEEFKTANFTTVNSKTSNTPVKIETSKRSNQLTTNVSDCIIERAPKETLWRIASRYKKEWRVDIYTAMVAIFIANKNKFTQQHIAHLIENKVLECPTSESLKMLSEKGGMDIEFYRLEKHPF